VEGEFENVERHSIESKKLKSRRSGQTSGIAKKGRSNWLGKKNPREELYRAGQRETLSYGGKEVSKRGELDRRTEHTEEWNDREQSKL